VKDFTIDLGGVGNFAARYHLRWVSFRKSLHMRILPIVAVLALLGSAAVAQTGPPQGNTGAYGSDAADRPVGGPAPDVFLGPGRDIVGPDGNSTEVVRAAPCSTTAHETDGTTTCIGIPGSVRI
jgi:hypothetical protein